jgi:hypothetical protein
MTRIAQRWVGDVAESPIMDNSPPKSGFSLAEDHGYMLSAGFHAAPSRLNLQFAFGKNAIGYRKLRNRLLPKYSFVKSQPHFLYACA